MHGPGPRTLSFKTEEGEGGRGEAELRRASPALWSELGLGGGRNRLGTERQFDSYPQLHRRWPDGVVPFISGGQLLGWSASSSFPGAIELGEGLGRTTVLH